VGCVTLHAVIDDNFICPDFEPNRTQRAVEFKSYPMGKGVSCAGAVTSLGRAGSTIVFVLCGKSETPLYEEVLRASGIKAVYVLGGPDHTRRHVTIINPTLAGPATHIQVPGIPHPPELFGQDGPVMKHVSKMAQECAVVGLSGSLPPGAPPDFYATLITAVNALGSKAVLDTSGAPLLAGLSAGPFAIKPNRAEAEQLLGRAIGPGIIDVGAAVHELLLHYKVTWVLLSDGKDGVVVGGPAGVYHGQVVLTPELTGSIVSDQGCGDSLVAAFLVSIVEEDGKVLADPPMLLRRLLAAATANLFNGLPGKLSLEHLDMIQDGRIALEVTALPKLQ